MRPALLLVLATVLAAAAASADDQGHWYKVTVDEKDEDGASYTYVGSSPLDLPAITAALGGHQPILLANLRAWTGGAYVPWREQLPEDQGEVVLNSAHVISIRTLRGDPLQAEVGEPARPRHEAPADRL